jgi:SAM-dependent methyltransferase
VSTPALAPEVGGPARREVGLAPLSAPATSRAVIELLADLDWPRARVADVGAGAGPVASVLAAALEQRHGLDPRAHVFPCDRHPEHFRARTLACRAVPESGRLPFGDAFFDAVVSIEVIEHVEDQFAFLHELVRVTKPGGRVVVTTPNVLSLTSRVRTLFWGFPELFDPLPLAGDDRRRLGGHIHPIAPYYLAYAALQAGLERPRLCTDRVKRSALAWLVPLGPALLLGRALAARRFARKCRVIARENADVLRAVGSFRMLTGRTAILMAYRSALGPAAAAPSHDENGSPQP